MSLHCPLCGEAVEDVQGHLTESHSPEEMMEMMPEMMKPIEQLQFSRASGFRKHYASEIVIESTLLDFRIYAINETQQQQQPGVIMTTKIQECAFIIAPIAAKTFHENLGVAIQQYEEQLGAIKPPKLKKK